MLPSRPVWIEIDHDAIRFNYQQIRAHVKNGTQMLAVVKADAYGHGAVEVSRTLQEEGLDRLAVAMPEEAEELREAGITLPIHVLGEILPQQYPLIAEYDLIQTIGRNETALGLAAQARRAGTRQKVFIMCDTGMGRLGPLPEETVDFVKDTLEIRHLEVEGIMTHLARADEVDEEYSLMQWDLFQKILVLLDEEGIDIPIKSIANSPALVMLPELHLDMVRPGIILYGMRPSLSFEMPFEIKPALSWKAKITSIKTLPAGHGVSYSTVYFAEEGEKIAVIPLGYEDGYFRSLSNIGEVLIHGQRAPLRGRMCMDQFMVSVDHIPDVKVGDEVVLLGSQEDEEIRAYELGSKAGTLNYDITCSISPRVPIAHIGRNAHRKEPLVDKGLNN